MRTMFWTVTVTSHLSVMGSLFTVGHWHHHLLPDLGQTTHLTKVTPPTLPSCDGLYQLLWSQGGFMLMAIAVFYSGLQPFCISSHKAYPRRGRTWKGCSFNMTLHSLNPCMSFVTDLLKAFYIWARYNWSLKTLKSKLYITTQVKCSLPSLYLIGSLSPLPRPLYCLIFWDTSPDWLHSCFLRCIPWIFRPLLPWACLQRAHQSQHVRYS